ncbi:MAG: hypothetical protein JJT89_02860 [Nitriliruptoraceae bacterium]|nr:hypothetical protein [Nitriliruptoraceae bacterium]
MSARHVEPMRWVRSGACELGVLPGRGGRIGSLRDLRTDREWLVQPTVRRELRYGGVFTDADMAGWDEMVPTITACPLPGDPARQLPDHGEVWAVPWDVEEADDHHLRMSVRGTVTGYRFTRTITVQDPSTFVWHYELERTDPRPAPLLWAAHPQLRWEPGSRVVLDPGVDEVVDVTAAGAPRVAWDADAASWLDHATTGTSRKFWLDPAARPERVGLVGPSGSLWLAWSASAVPYLGIWFDAAHFAGERAVALEPSTGYRDDLAFAAANGTAPVLEPGERRSWSLTVSLDPLPG